MDNAQDKYRGLLVEIKRRTEVLDTFIFRQTNTLYLPPTLESASLQVRKILELIAFGSLVANLEIFSSEYKKFSKYWNASLMLKDMERVNPNFYPKPIIQKKSEKPGVKMDLLDRKDNFLTQDDFIKVYEKCGAIMHADNPYGSKVDYGYYDEQLLVWRNKIVNLLNAHTIKLVNDNNLYLFQMGAKDSWPSYTSFERVGTDDVP